MQCDSSLLCDLLIIAGLIGLTGLFVAGEYGLVRSNPLHLKSVDGRRKLGSRTSLRLIEDMELSLAATQFGITLCTIILGWWGERILAGVFRDAFLLLGEPARTAVTHGVSTFLAVLFLILIQTVFGELVAKSLAVRFPEETLRILSGAILVFAIVCRPFLFVSSRLAGLVLRIMRVQRGIESDRVHSLAELTFLVSKSTEGGLLDKEEEQMVRGIFGLSETVAREIMTPRTDLVTIPVDATFEEVLNIIRESGLSRFPVCGDTVDDVLGVLLARDILSFVVPGLFHNERTREDFRVRKLMREAYFVAGTKRIDDLLSEFKMRKLHLAVVLDEHGGVDGVVTLEDLIEEIVGDIFDESDIPERTITVEENGEVLIDGGQLVADLNSRFGLEIPEGDYDTIAGYIFTALGRMPRPGDRIIVNRSAPPRDAPKEEPEPPAPSTATDGAEEGVDELDTSTFESPFEEGKALLTVERVQSYRIETVRLCLDFTPPESESDSSDRSSKSVNSFSERET